VIATVGAFFVTTRLKRSTPVIEQLTFRRSFSPNGDARFDVALFAFRLRRTDEVTVSLVTRDGDEVRTLTRDVLLSGGKRHRFRWDGRTDAGRVARDGEYHLRVGLRRQGRTVTSGRKLFLDTRPPRPVVRYVTPDFFSPDGAGRANSVRLRFSGASRRARLLVYRTDLPRPRLVARRPIARGQSTLRWDGRLMDGRPAPTGNYLLVVRAQDAAGNVGPPRLPPGRGAEGNPGVAVRYVAAVGPLRPVRAGALTRFEVLTDGRRYRWSVRRPGSRRALARGSSRRAGLTVRAPRGRSGIALLTVRAGSHRYTTPFGVRDRAPARVLVVLPAATWQARNPLETDGDGYGDVLPEVPDVGLRRPFAGTGMPPGFVPDQAAVLGFLRAEGYRFDLASDLGLARPGAAALSRYRGVLFAGPPRFAPAGVRALLRSYLRVGGRVAWLGTGAFEWSVTTRRERLVRGTHTPLRPLGERVQARRAQPLAVLGDRVGFFRGAAAGLGPFGRLEESMGLPPGARPLASAGREADRPAIVVYRRGPGVVARVGVDRFGRALATSPDAARIMRRLWALLSR
jgi:hypothetical protein